MTEEKEWRCGDLVSVGPMQWQCDVIRASDGHVVKTVSITPETLPARTRGKKVVWALPTDGSTPKLAITDQERVINLFRELRKRGKKERKLKEEEVKAKAAEAATAEKKNVRYSVEELLALRNAPASTPLPQEFHCKELLANAGAESLPLPPQGAGGRSSGLGGWPDRRQRDPLHAPPGLELASPVTSPPGLLSAFDSNKPTRGVASLETSRPPGLPLSTAAALPVAANSEVIESNIDDDEAAWKHAWKMNYMKRLDGLADMAWKNHLSQRASAAQNQPGLN